MVEATCLLAKTQQAGFESKLWPFACPSLLSLPSFLLEKGSTFCEPMQTVTSASCSYLRGIAPSVVFCCSPSALRFDMFIDALLRSTQHFHTENCCSLHISFLLDHSLEMILWKNPNKSVVSETLGPAFLATFFLIFCTRQISLNVSHLYI